MPSATLLATRQSPLALKQTEMALAWLRAKLPEASFDSLPLTTQVDERLTWSLEQRGGIGLFTKELEDALLDGRATLAVHSAKDLPTTFQADLCIAGYLPRARATDVLVHLSGHPSPKIIATSSPRRRAQLGILQPQAEWTTIRGNVGTRMRKIVEDGEAEATLLAAAGLDRLDIQAYPGLEFLELSVEQVVPAPGQAAIAIQCRQSELAKYQDLFCPQTKLAVTLERSFLQRLGGGCQTPVGAHYAENTFHIFHPEVGYRNFPFELTTLDQIPNTLDQVLNQLQL